MSPPTAFILEASHTVEQIATNTVNMLQEFLDSQVITARASSTALMNKCRVADTLLTRSS